MVIAYDVLMPDAQGQAANKIGPQQKAVETEAKAIKYFMAFLDTLPYEPASGVKKYGV